MVWLLDGKMFDTFSHFDTIQACHGWTERHLATVESATWA